MLFLWKHVAEKLSSFWLTPQQQRKKKEPGFSSPLGGHVLGDLETSHWTLPLRGPTTFQWSYGWGNIPAEFRLLEDNQLQNIAGE